MLGLVRFLLVTVGLLFLAFAAYAMVDAASAIHEIEAALFALLGLAVLGLSAILRSRRSTRQESHPGPADAPRRVDFSASENAPAGWPVIFDHVSIVGEAHGLAAIGDFVSAATRAGRFSARLRFEPDNPHDSRAIAVDGVAGGKAFHMGYLSRRLAWRIAQNKPDEVELAAKLLWMTVDRRHVHHPVDIVIDIYASEDYEAA